MAEIVLNVEVRERAGTGGARAVRREGKVPGVLYGGKQAPVAIAVKQSEFRKALYTGKLLGHLVTLKYGEETQPVIAKDVQFHPVTDEPTHFDLYRVDAHQQIRIAVPVHFRNQEASPGIKRGGTLNINLHELELMAPPTRSPKNWWSTSPASTSATPIRAADVELPAGVELELHVRDATVASIATSSAMQSEEAETAEAARRRSRSRRRTYAGLASRAAMLILAGLGNPEPKYAKNRHNVGFAACQVIMPALGLRPRARALLRPGQRGPDPDARRAGEGADPAPADLLQRQRPGRGRGDAVLQGRARRRGGVLRRDRPGPRALPDEDRRRGGGQQRRPLDRRPHRPGLPPRPAWARAIRATRIWCMGHVPADFSKAELAWVRPLLEACADALPLLAAGEDERYQAEVLRLAPAPKLDPRAGRRGARRRFGTGH